MEAIGDSLARRFPGLVAALTDSHFVELDRENLIIHKRTGGHRSRPYSIPIRSPAAALSVSHNKPPTLPEVSDCVIVHLNQSIEGNGLRLTVSRTFNTFAVTA